ncbi:MAG TPA: hypothetical protein PLO24_07760 [Bacteroidales bacterium]|jgi:hypothetical protein|nr:hypothetical protein [Bacteroidales bacterium]HOS72428.1 hypothetical protein [Bacteroidales bacterium]HQH24946.1 hypothetical protein [Bacteroidales bacterium]HQJ82350.1 hypothetical protein [Bacteroidales bacterium]
MKKIIIVLTISALVYSCGGRSGAENQKSKDMTTETANQYAWNRDFLKKHVDIIELKRDNSAVALVPSWQGRVMTSTAEGENGFSFGWINHQLIESGIIQPHINAFGGEERLWLGPEGGQFSIFFRKGDDFVYDNWQTPSFLDTDPFEVVRLNDTSAFFACNAEAVNYSGTPLKFRIEREVGLLDRDAIKKQTGIDPGGLNVVAYRSDNSLINKGQDEWKKETGLLSIWMLGMFTPSPSVIVAIPFNPGDEKIMGPPVNDDYFGKIAADRLRVEGSHIFFRCDGKSRGKIGLPPLRSKGIMGSYDSANNILTLLICDQPRGKNDYVNSAWQLQEDPYSGDALNSYNDGPLEDGSQMGPFYELEASSPGAALKAGEKLTHTQFTIHASGDKNLLNKIALDKLGLSLDAIARAFD